MSIKFTPSDGPTLGVEVELQIVDLESRNLVPRAPELLAAVPQHRSHFVAKVPVHGKEFRAHLVALQEPQFHIRLKLGVKRSGRRPLTSRHPWPMT